MTVWIKEMFVWMGYKICTVVNELNEFNQSLLSKNLQLQKYYLSNQNQKLIYECYILTYKNASSMLREEKPGESFHFLALSLSNWRSKLTNIAILQKKGERRKGYEHGQNVWLEKLPFIILSQGFKFFFWTSFRYIQVSVMEYLRKF